MRAIVYYRVSKKTTCDNIETQKAEMTPWLESLKDKKGYQIPEGFIFEKQKSGEEIEKRPKGERDVVKAPANTGMK